MYAVVGGDRTYFENLNVNVQLLYRRIQAFEDPLAVAPPLRRLALNPRIVREEKAGGVDCWVIESLPRTSQVRDDTGYGRRVGWIRKDNYAAVRAEGYDVSGALLKVITLKDLRNVDPKNGKWVAMRLEAQNVQENRRTVIEFDKYEVNQGVPEDAFTARAMEKES